MSAVKKEEGDKKRKQADLDKQYNNAKKDLENSGINFIFQNEWKKIIDKAVKKKEVSIPITDNNGHDSSLWPRERALVDVGTEFLQNQGFRVEYKFEYSPEVGSDDLYGHRTYIYLLISW